MTTDDLPMSWVDKIFTKLTLTYGRDFLARWEGLDMADVKADWAHELAGFQRFPEGIKHALEHLPPGKPPTVREFRDMARKAPPPEFKALPAPQADPAVVAEVMAQASQAVAATAHDPKAWAHRILREHEAGVKVRAVRLRFAREALGIKPEGPCA
ncbi:hypothetical protein CCO03_17070 [Comamonas serinivorans]|uniref:Uncharacterized protein n=1 Tax=Comamonas serinivorans TaxID=1082851 RepID=A0A1Y0ERM5_9BURK|nr:hypothetical protein [Comamonas serinivorans]ARU06158.1 hypothetical protein CCO03_17070 [Comamonas serinivorans]